jgi:hypothetical protein
MRIKRLFKYFCPLALLIVVTPVILTSCSNVISSLKNYVLNGGIRADVDQTVRTLNTITIYNNNTSYLSLPDDAVLTAITSDLKNNLKISDKDIATRYYYPYPIEKLSATQMK